MYYAEAVKCFAQGLSREKKTEDPVQLETRTPKLLVKHFTTEPRQTPECDASGGIFLEKDRKCFLKRTPCFFYKHFPSG